jgi:hypothetical protein
VLPALCCFHLLPSQLHLYSLPLCLGLVQYMLQILHTQSIHSDEVVGLVPEFNHTSHAKLHKELREAAATHLLHYTL